MSVSYMRLLVSSLHFDLHLFIMAAKFGELNLERASQQWWAEASRNT